MKVSNPNLQGKIYLKYDGNNVQQLEQQIKLHRTRLFDCNIDGDIENLLVNFRLHNNIEIGISLNSMRVYVYDNDWKKDQESICHITNILVDNENVMIKGVLNYFNSIHETNVYIEPYSFDLMFRSVYAILAKLESEKVLYTDFRIMDN